MEFGLDKKLYMDKVREYSLGVLEFCKVYRAKSEEEQRADYLIEDLMDCLGKIGGYSPVFMDVKEDGIEYDEELKEEMLRDVLGKLARSSSLWRTMIALEACEDVERVDGLREMCDWMWEYLMEGFGLEPIELPEEFYVDSGDDEDD